NEQASRQGFRLLGQSARPSGQPGQMRTKGGVQPLNVGGVDDPRCLLRQLAQPFYLLLTTLNNASLNFQTRRQASFDHLHQSDVGPGNQLRPTWLAFNGQGGAKSSLKRFHIARQAINGQQQGATKGDSPNLLG